MARRTKNKPKTSSRKSQTGQFNESGTRHGRDALHARMQTHKARRAVDALFSATDAELNRRDS